MITLAFMRYSQEIHLKAIDTLTNNLKFLPTKADVVEVCDKLEQARKWRKPTPEEAKLYRREHPYLDRDPEWIPRAWQSKIRVVK